jgi:hypothetical protein
MGAPEEFITQINATQQNFLVDPENWQSVQAFMGVQTQWRAGSSGPIGLDYTALQSTLPILGFEVTKELMRDIQVIEFTALNVFAEKDA